MLYEVVLNSEYVGQSFVNRWNYNSSGDAAAVLGSFGLASAMGFVPSGGIYPTGTILEAIRLTTHAATTFKSASVRALRDFEPTDFYEVPFLASVTGSRTGEGNPPFVGFGFRTTRTRTDIRRATKRIGGTSEDDFLAGGAVHPDAVARVQLVATRMSAVLSYDDEGNTITYTPVVCKRNKTVDPTTGAVSYPYYSSLPAQLANISSGFIWEPYSTARSQVSRQYGRGV